MSQDRRFHLRVSIPRAFVAVGVLAFGLVACDRSETPTSDELELHAAEPTASGSARAMDGGSVEADGADSAVTPSEPPNETSPEEAAADRPLLGIRNFAVNVYAKPETGSTRLGYLRVGATVPRSEEPVSRRRCKGGWFKIEPKGYVCAGKDATTDLTDPLLRASARRPRLDKALPYRYGFVRATTPLYLRVPTAELQHKREFKLGEHLEWFKSHKAKVQSSNLGALDLPVDRNGFPIEGKRLGELGREPNSRELSVGQLFGGRGDEDPWPFWLRHGERLIPNISGFDVPEYAVFADRARRHTGLAFIGSFDTDPLYLNRRFGIMTDLRLVPTTKVKPDSGSPWHGVELGGGLKLPLAFVNKRGVQRYAIEAGEARPVKKAKRRGIYLLSGKLKKIRGEKFYQTKRGRWLRGSDVGLAVQPRKWPRMAKRGEKWIEIDLSEQILIMWNGKKAEFATLISSGRPAIGDPKTTTASPRGVFRIYSKHISATMDSDEGQGRKANHDNNLKPGDKGYVPTRGDGIYGVSVRRGHGLFKLRDVPHIQYFNKNYAIHGAYWHDVFGIPRSHGCINLAPADSLRVFKWTEPQVPKNWHGVRTEKGTAVLLHK